jgi:hypothetical protein
MTVERQVQIGKILREIRELAPGDRIHYLQHAPGIDESLRLEAKF